MSPLLTAPLANGTAATGRTGFGFALPAAMLNLPVVTALVTVPADSRHTKSTPLDVQGGSLHQGLGDLAASLCHDPLESGTGDAHLLGSLFLVTPFQVGQPQRLQLLVKKGCAVQRFQRHPDRLEYRRLRRVHQSPVLTWTRHRCPDFRRRVAGARAAASHRRRLRPRAHPGRAAM